MTWEDWLLIIIVVIPGLGVIGMLIIAIKDALRP